MSACLDDEEANVRRPSQRDGRRDRLGTNPLEPNKLGGIPGRVDDGVAATLASTPADEGLEADDTSRSMAHAGQGGIVSGRGARRRGRRGNGERRRARRPTR